MKKFLSVLCALALTGAALAGCGNEAEILPSISVTDEVVEDADSDISDEVSSVVEQPPADLENWQIVYGELLLEKASEWDNMQFSLIYVDKDDVPELYVEGPDTATGAFIYGIDEGTNKAVESVNGYPPLSYIPRGGIVLAGTGHDIISEYVADYSRGTAHVCWYGEIDYISEEEPQYKIYGEEADAELYESSKNDFYDASKIVSDYEYHDLADIMSLCGIKGQG